MTNIRHAVLHNQCW